MNMERVMDMDMDMEVMDMDMVTMENNFSSVPHHVVILVTNLTVK